MFYAFMLGTLALAAAGLGQAWVRRRIDRGKAASYLLVCVLLSYPVWFEFKLGNIELFLFPLIALGVWGFLSGRSWLPILCFGAAAALKIFPLVYLCLFLVKKQYREAALGVLVAIAITVGSLWAVCPNIGLSAHGISQGMEEFKQYAMLHRLIPEIGFDHSIFALVKSVPRQMPPPESVAVWLTVYLAVAALAGLCILIFRVRRLPVYNQVLCLTLAAVLLPPLSVDYTLLHLYVPWAMLTLLLIDSQGRKLPGATLMIVCFALAFSPLSEFILGGRTVQGQMRSVILLVLGYAALRYPMAIEDTSQAEIHAA